MASSREFGRSEQHFDAGTHNPPGDDRQSQRDVSQLVQDLHNVAPGQEIFAPQPVRGQEPGRYLHLLHHNQYADQRSCPTPRDSGRLPGQGSSYPDEIAWMSWTPPPEPARDHDFMSALPASESSQSQDGGRSLGRSLYQAPPPSAFSQLHRRPGDWDLSSQPPQRLEANPAPQRSWGNPIFGSPAASRLYDEPLPPSSLPPHQSMPLPQRQWGQIQHIQHVAITYSEGYSAHLDPFNPLANPGLSQHSSSFLPDNSSWPSQLPDGGRPFHQPQLANWGDPAFQGDTGGQRGLFHQPQYESVSSSFLPADPWMPAAQPLGVQSPSSHLWGTSGPAPAFDGRGKSERSGLSQSRPEGNFDQSLYGPRPSGRRKGGKSSTPQERVDRRRAEFVQGSSTRPEQPSQPQFLSVGSTLDESPYRSGPSSKRSKGGKSSTPQEHVDQGKPPDSQRPSRSEAAQTSSIAAMLPPALHAAFQARQRLYGTARREGRKVKKEEITKEMVKAREKYNRKYRELNPDKIKEANIKAKEELKDDKEKKRKVLDNQNKHRDEARRAIKFVEETHRGFTITLKESGTFNAVRKRFNERAHRNVSLDSFRAKIEQYEKGNYESNGENDEEDESDGENGSQSGGSSQ